MKRKKAIEKSEKNERPTTTETEAREKWHPIGSPSVLHNDGERKKQQVKCVVCITIVK